MDFKKNNFTYLIWICLFFSTVKTNNKAYDVCMDTMKKYCHSYILDGLQEPKALHCVKAAINNWQLIDNTPANGVDRLNDLVFALDDCSPMPLDLEDSTPEDFVITLAENGVIPQSFFREYYKSFKDNLDIASVPSPKQFCDEHIDKHDLYIRCLTELQPFGNTTEDALHYALYYNTRSGNNTPTIAEVKNIDFSKVSREELKELEAPFYGVPFGFIYIGRLSVFIKLVSRKIKQPKKFCQEVNLRALRTSNQESTSISGTLDLISL